MKKLSNYGIMESRITIRMRNFIIKKVESINNFNLAETLEILGRNEEILKCWDEGILINPNNLEFYKEKSSFHL